MALHIVNTEFEIHVTPLERVVFDLHNLQGLLVEFDDVHERRIQLRFRAVAGLKMIDEDYLNYNAIKVEGKFPRRLLELAPPEWAGQYVTVAQENLQKRLTVVPSSPLRHFILPFQDYVVEVLASEFLVESGLGRESPT